jgi:hypothetical protein
VGAQAITKAAQHGLHLTRCASLRAQVKPIVGLLVHISDLEMPMLGQCHYQLSNRRWSNIGRHAPQDRPTRAPREKACD